MDTNICGLNKVVCRASSSSYAGRTVTITNGVNTWSGTIAEITGVGYACVFMIPSLPAPAKKTYTVTLYNSAGTSPEYQRDIELGFGDSIVIGLYTYAEIADKAYVLSEIDNHAYVLPKATSSSLGGVMVPTSNGLSVDSNGNVRMSVAGTDSVGVVKPGTGLQINSTTGALSLKKADTSNLGGIKVGTGLSVNSSTGALSLNTAGSSSSSKGGVYVQSGKGIRLGSDGEIYLPDQTFDNVSINVSPITIVAGDYYSTAFSIPSSNSAYNRILKGKINGISPDHGMGWIRFYYKSGNNISIYIYLINTSTTSSITVSSVNIYYSYYS